MSFNVGLSGLRAATSDLNVTGNNIANAGTVGFKQSRAEFADVYAAQTVGGGANPVGSGVLLAGVSQLFKQGNTNNTQNGLDLAINGNGFFQTSNNGDVSYTRAGYFGTDKEGFVVNNFGYNLQGYAVDVNGNLQNGVVSDLRVQTASQAPKATTQMDQSFNLNSTNQIPTNLTFDPNDPTSYNSATSTNIYDSQGNSHVLTQYFLKTGPNVWQMNTLIDGRNPLDPTLTTPFTAGLTFSTAGLLTAQTSTDFTVNAVDGTLDMTNWVPAAPNTAIPPVWSSNGASASATGVNIDLRTATQFSSTFAVSSVTQDGYTTGQLSGLEVDDTGIMFARYTNGQSKIQGQVVLANFANQQGLTPVGKTAWIQSFESGEPVVGTPRSGTLGALQSGALEDSNVELSDQLVNLIVAQRNYQANAKTIETESAITQTIINLR
ncbi:MAG: flagellar hook protein FlgE [Pseudomonas sp.]|uniref:flagellar hook protein FlgE n=1 Tax=Pseudomonas sp. TaxID=306 RepID=UPI002733675C|nr:flagellar hook protein FlgE [Pseudomonas sp.]MDP3846033.1 flagellar hook protein FlgE [Pseudomonas sp.]